jgi:MYXO-CTERM domain-containing protein
MEPASPARLYATLVGAALFVGGIVGFFYDLSWINYAHVATGALGLLLAGAAPRPYALCIGLVYLGLAVWGFSSGEEWQWPHLALGLLGLAAAVSTRRSSVTHDVPKEPRGDSGKLKARTKAAAKGA